jgi:hypothetical protein
MSTKENIRPNNNSTLAAILGPNQKSSVEHKNVPPDNAVVSTQQM